MKKDVSWNVFFENNERFADFVNACGCCGKQIVKPEDLQPLDSKNIQSATKKGKLKTCYRDGVRKVAFGINFAIVGIEHQENVNYAMPLTVMRYDLGEYERQKREITRGLEQDYGEINDGEFLYGFKKDSRIQPVITFVLYCGDSWDGATELKEILDERNIPDSLKDLVQNYKVNLIDVRKIQDTSVFQTDIKQVFDFIRYSEDKVKLRELMQENSDYESISEEAFDVIVKYAKVTGLKKENAIEGGKVKMCLAMKEWAEDERAEGRIEGREEGIRQIVRNMLKKGMEEEEIMSIAERAKELLEEEKASLSSEINHSEFKKLLSRS